MKSVKDKIRCIGVIRDLFERVRTEPKAKEQYNMSTYCVVLSSRQHQSARQRNNLFLNIATF